MIQKNNTSPYRSPTGPAGLHARYAPDPARGARPRCGAAASQRSSSSAAPGQTPPGAEKQLRVLCVHNVWVQEQSASQQRRVQQLGLRHHVRAHIIEQQQQATGSNNKIGDLLCCGSGCAATGDDGHCPASSGAGDRRFASSWFLVWQDAAAPAAPSPNPGGPLLRSSTLHC